MKSCCDFHVDIDCQQGKSCPARASKHWCETSRQPCAQPYTCAAGCQIKSDNCLQRADAYTWALTPMGWVVLAGLVSWLAAITVYFFYF